MKIAFVSEHASPLAVLGGVDAGGQNVHVAALSDALARQGHEVRTYTRRDSARLPSVVDTPSGATVFHVDAGPPVAIEKDRLLPYMDEFARELRHSWEQWRPDVVHAHFWMSGYASLRAAIGADFPVVQTFHALGAEKRHFQGNKDTSPSSRIEEEERIARNATHIVATAAHEAFELIRMGVGRDRITVIPCGVDLELFSALGTREQRPSPRPRIVCISRLVERKGIDDVITALAYLPEAELVIAGGPAREDVWNDPEARRLREHARRNGVSDRVELRGRVERGDVPQLLRAADVCVCYPWYEPFGIVPLEAMACGVPVVVARVGGLVDSVVDGVNGCHVEPRSPKALADTLRGLLRDEQLRVTLGLAGARRASARYGWHRIACDTAAVYHQVRTERHFAAKAFAS